MVSVVNAKAFSLDSMPRVYVTRELPEDLMAPLLAKHDVGFWAGDNPVPGEVLRRQAGRSEGLLTMITESVDAHLLDAAPHLRVVSQMAVGVDNIDVEACRRRGVRIGHTPGVLTETVADTAMAILSSVVRRLPEGEKTVRNGEWGPWHPFWMTGGDLHGTTLGVVGMGRIGRAIARRAEGFGMTILYTATGPKEDARGEFVALEHLLEVSDHLVLCVALNEETTGLMGTAQFETMKSSATLVNVSRGPVVDTDALVEALIGGEIAAAGLDVTDPEPLPADHPLLSLSNCLVVPHIGSASVDTRREMARLAIANLLAGLADQPMPAEFPD